MNTATTRATIVIAADTMPDKDMGSIMYTLLTAKDAELQTSSYIKYNADDEQPVHMLIIKIQCDSNYKLVDDIITLNQELPFAWAEGHSSDITKQLVDNVYHDYNYED